MSEPILQHGDSRTKSRREDSPIENKEKGKKKLQGLARRANEVAQHSHIGTISADAPRVHGQA